MEMKKANKSEGLVDQFENVAEQLLNVAIVGEDEMTDADVATAEDVGTGEAYPQTNEGELSINHPYFFEVLHGFDQGLRAAARAVQDDDVATVTVKVQISKDEAAPDFANEAKIFNQAKFSVSVSLKREINKYNGETAPFGTRMVDGHMMLLNPDRQIALDEIINQAQEEVGNVPPPAPDLMADAPVDPAMKLDAFDN